MRRCGYLLLLLIAVSTIIPKTVASPPNEDKEIFSGTLPLTSGEYTTYNLTCFEGEGYYGHLVSENGPISFLIVRTEQLELFIEGEVSPEEAWMNQTLHRWEYPCTETANMTFALTPVYNENSIVDFSVKQDNTPVYVDIDVERVSLYLPAYNLTFTFTGGFFVSALVEVINGSFVRRLYGNGTITWEAYYYNGTLGAYISYPDGNYIVRVNTEEEMGRHHENQEQIFKAAGREATEFTILLVSATMISIVVEIARRRFAS